MKRAGILFLSLAIILVCATVFVIANRPDAPEVIDRVEFNFEAGDVYAVKVDKAYEYNAFSDTDAKRIEHFINEIKNADYKLSGGNIQQTLMYTVYFVDDVGNSLSCIKLYTDNVITFNGVLFTTEKPEERALNFIDNLYRCTLSFDKEHMPIKKPEGESFDFWIADDVTEQTFDSKNAFGNNLYLDSAYRFVNPSEDGAANTEENLPEFYVYYEAEKYTDFSGSYHRITRIRITDPEVEILGATAYSTSAKFQEIMCEYFGDENVYTSDENHRSTTYSLDGISITLYKDLTEKAEHYIEINLEYYDLGYQMS